MKVTDTSFLSIEQLQDRYLSKQGTADSVSGEEKASFEQILKQKQTDAAQDLTELKFSKHAMGRLSDRNIELSDGQMERLSEGAVKAGEKGIKESLVLMDELAFIVNIPNKTVVTAMDSSETQSNVFTNIDGAVIV